MEVYETVEGLPVEVCVNVLSGELASDNRITARITPTSTGTAIGEHKNTPSLIAIYYSTTL